MEDMGVLWTWKCNCGVMGNQNGKELQKLGLGKSGLGAGEKSHLDSCWEVWILCADYSARF